MAKRNVDIKVSFIDGASKGLASLRKSIGEVSTGIVSLGKDAAKVTAQFAALGAAAGAVALAGFGAAVSKAVASAADLEAQINRVAAATNAAAEDIPALFAAAEGGARETTFNVTETSAALETLGREGLTAAQAVGALPAALDLAQAASVGAAEGAGILTDVLGQFGLGAEQAGIAADVLAAASIKGGTSLQQLFRVLQAAGPAARQAGVSLDEAAAAAALLAQNGIEGGKAGAALTQVFNQLNNAASPFSKALTDLGIKSRDFGTVLQELQARGINAQKAFVALGNESAAAIRILAQNGGANLRELTAEFQRSQGAAQALADQMEQGFNAALQRLQDTLAGVARTAALPLLDPLTDSLTILAQKVQEFAESDQFARILESVQKFAQEAGEAFAKFIEEIDFTEVADSVISFVQTSREKFSEFTDAFGQVAAFVEGAVDAISVAFNVLQTGVQAVAGVITAALAGVATAKLALAKALQQVSGEIVVSAEAVAQLENEIQTLNDAAAAYFEAAKQNAGETRQAFADLTETTAGTTDATRQLGDAGADAAGKVSEFSETLKTVAPDANAAAEGMIAAAQAANQVGEESAEARGAVQGLSREFVVLGENSKKGLQEAADSALANVATIRQQVEEGIASQQDLLDAQLKAQQAITRAGRDSVSTQRQAQDELGNTSKQAEKISGDMDRAGRAGANAGQQTAGSFANAAGQIANASQQTERLVDSFERAREAGALAGAEIGKLSGQYNRAAASLGDVSREFEILAAEGLQALIQGGVSGRAQVDRLNEGLAQQNREYAEINERLDRQIQGYNQLDAAAQQVNDRFNFLSESQRQDLINKQKQLEQIQQQAQQQFNTPPPPSFTPPPPPSGGSGGGGRGGATTVNVTINANGVTTRELVEQIKREIEQAMRRAA